MRNHTGLILIFICIFLAGCGSDKIQPRYTDFLNDSIPSQESFNSTVTFSDSGKVKAVLLAGRIRVFAKQNITFVDSGAKVDFYSNDMVVSTLTARKGKIYDITKDVEVYDSVKIVSTDGTVLSTGKLYWINKTRRIKSDDFVYIKTGDQDIKGYGFESDPNLKNYVIYRVSGEIKGE